MGQKQEKKTPPSLHPGDKSAEAEKRDRGSQVDCRTVHVLTVTTLGSRCPVLTPRPLSLLAALFRLLWAGLWLCCACSLPGLPALMSPPAGPAPTATGPAHSPPCCSPPPPPLGTTTAVGLGLPPRNCNNRHKREFMNRG